MRPIDELLSKKKCIEIFESQRDYVDGEFVYGKFLFPSTKGRFDSNKVRSKPYSDEDKKDNQTKLDL